MGRRLFADGKRMQRPPLVPVDGVLLLSCCFPSPLAVAWGGPESEGFVVRLLTVGEARERFGVERLGFMGVTHALSAVTVAGVAIGLFPRVVTGLWDAPTLALLVGFVASVAGWSMVPDLDNTSARAISDLGPVGRVLSFLFRESSSFVQGVTATKYDRRSNNFPDPHRGLWHTFVGALVMGGLVWLAVSAAVGSVTVWGVNVGVGALAASLFVGVSFHLAVSSLFKRAADRVKRGLGFLGDVVAFLLSLAVGFAVVWVGSGQSLVWVPVAAAVGMLIHDLGDTCTTSGTPLFAPLVKIRGKRWYSIRLSSIKAGGEVETHGIAPLLGACAPVACVFALWRVWPLLVSFS